jgi:hypothetical protein
MNNREHLLVQELKHDIFVVNRLLKERMKREMLPNSFVMLQLEYLREVSKLVKIAENKGIQKVEIRKHRKKIKHIGSLSIASLVCLKNKESFMFELN